MQNKILIALLAILSVLYVHPAQAAKQKYIINKERSVIDCSVDYALIGTYDAVFKDLKGFVYFDPKAPETSSVFISIKVASVTSKYPVLDRMVRSRRLLDAGQYPEATFMSTAIQQQGAGFLVTGLLSMHGVSQTISFPFSLEAPIRDYPKKKYLKAKGTWAINRKDFGIVWNKYLDKGSVVVSDEVTMDWKIVAEIEG